MKKFLASLTGSDSTNSTEPLLGSDINSQRNGTSNIQVTYTAVEALLIKQQKGENISAELVSSGVTQDALLKLRLTEINQLVYWVVQNWQMADGTTFTKEQRSQLALDNKVNLIWAALTMNGAQLNNVIASVYQSVASETQEDPLSRPYDVTTFGGINNNNNNNSPTRGYTTKAVVESGGGDLLDSGVVHSVTGGNGKKNTKKSRGGELCNDLWGESGFKFWLTQAVLPGEPVYGTFMLKALAVSTIAYFASEAGAWKYDNDYDTEGEYTGNTGVLLTFQAIFLALVLQNLWCDLNGVNIPEDKIEDPSRTYQVSTKRYISGTESGDQALAKRVSGLVELTKGLSLFSFIALAATDAIIMGEQDKDQEGLNRPWLYFGIYLSLCAVNYYRAFTFKNFEKHFMRLFNFFDKKGSNPFALDNKWGWPKNLVGWAVLTEVVLQTSINALYRGISAGTQTIWFSEVIGWVAEHSKDASSSAATRALPSLIWSSLNSMCFEGPRSLSGASTDNSHEVKVAPGAFYLALGLTVLTVYITYVSRSLRPIDKFFIQLPSDTASAAAALASSSSSVEEGLANADNSPFTKINSPSSSAKGITDVDKPSSGAKAYDFVFSLVFSGIPLSYWLYRMIADSNLQDGENYDPHSFETLQEGSGAGIAALVTGVLVGGFMMYLQYIALQDQRMRAAAKARIDKVEAGTESSAVRDMSSMSEMDQKREYFKKVFEKYDTPELALFNDVCNWGSGLSRAMTFFVYLYVLVVMCEKYDLLRPGVIDFWEQVALSLYIGFKNQFADRTHYGVDVKENSVCNRAKHHVISSIADDKAAGMKFEESKGLNLFSWKAVADFSVDELKSASEKDPKFLINFSLPKLSGKLSKV